MNEILGYFFHPEISMEALLVDESKRKWKDGLLKWVLGAILVGLLTVIIYIMADIKLESLLSTYYGSIVKNLIAFNIDVGFIWLALAVVIMVEILISAIFKAVVWIILIYLMSKLCRDSIPLKQIIKMIIFGMLIWIASQVFGNIVICFCQISSVQTLNEMLIGLSTILHYWYLILFIIGYSILSRVTFLKGSVVILTIQGVLWMIINTFPLIGIFLG